MCSIKTSTDKHQLWGKLGKEMRKKECPFYFLLKAIFHTTLISHNNVSPSYSKMSTSYFCVSCLQCRWLISPILALFSRLQTEHLCVCPVTSFVGALFCFSSLQQHSFCTLLHIILYLSEPHCAKQDGLSIFFPRFMVYVTFLESCLRSVFVSQQRSTLQSYSFTQLSEEDLLWQSVIWHASNVSSPSQLTLH